LVNINRVFLSGRLVAPAQLSHTQSGVSFVRFRIAVNNPYRDKDGNWQERTAFVNVVLWGERANRLVEKLDKGAGVYVEGELVQRDWEDENGNKRSTLEVRANRVALFRSSKKAEEPEEIDEEIDDVEV